MFDQIIEIDVWILENIQWFIAAHTSLVWLVHIFSDFEPILFWIGLVVLWIWWVYRREYGPRHVALDIFWHVLAVFLTYIFLNHFLPLRPRPETVTIYAPLIDHLPDNSFPSGHAIFWWASWWAWVRLLKKPLIAWSFFIIGWLTCLARIGAGVHYPSDIVVGFFIWWWLAELFICLPHGAWYKHWCHDVPIKIAARIWL